VEAIRFLLIIVAHRFNSDIDSNSCQRYVCHKRTKVFNAEAMRPSDSWTISPVVVTILKRFSGNARHGIVDSFAVPLRGASFHGLDITRKSSFSLVLVPATM